MRIGIIGAGQIGSTLAHLFVKAGHDVTIANSRGPDTLRQLDEELGRHGHAATAEQAASYGDVVVAAVPFGHYRELPAAPLAGKTVVDASNYFPERDGSIPELEDARDTTSSELLQYHLRSAHVVKAFNAMRWDHLRDYGHEAGANHRYGIPVSGDDPAAKRLVFDLIEQLGFEPVDAGHLAEGGRKHQPGTEVFSADLWDEDLRARVGVATG
jgi:predicted dinucleotide-binding enzyme